jgi:pimeloyl-ACP methyl ester carboxylesterase
MGRASVELFFRAFVCLLALTILATATVSGGPLAAAEGDPPEDAYAKVLAAYHKAMKRPSVESALRAVATLDPNESRSLPELLSVLQKGHWMVRGAAMELLARIEPGPLRDELRLNLVAHDDPWVREGTAYAMSIKPRPGDGDALIGAFDDDSWRVRRTTARALGEIVSRSGVKRLIEALEKETDLRVLVWVRASLRAIVGKDLGRDLRRWKEWWERNKDRPEWKRQGEEVVRKDFDGIPLETITIGGPPPGKAGDPPRKDTRPDLFVLAPFGFTHDWYRPYLDEAAQFVRITYITLPSVSEVTGQTGYGASIPVYPVRRLAKSLDSLRAALGKEQIVLLASGPVGWIAESYALRYPKRVAGLALLNTWIDSQSYAESLMRLSAGGRPTEKWAARVLMNEIPPDRDRREGQRLRRIFLTHKLSDRRDSEAYRLWRDASREHGFVKVPPLKFTKKVRITAPTLFTFPDQQLSLYSGGRSGDLRRIRASFKDPPPVIAEMRDSRGLSHLEDPAEFLRVLEGFLRYARILR